MDKITTLYLKHALKLIRLSNGASADASAAMRGMVSKIKKLLAGEDLATLGIVKLRKLIAAADQIVMDSLDGISGNQAALTEQLIAMESAWAKKIGKYDAAASDTMVARAISNFTVYGNTLDDHMAVIGQRLSNQIEAQIRLGAAAGQSDRQIIERIAGSGGRGGIFESASRNVAAIVDGATGAAADTGRRLAMAANGVNAIQWSAKMDEDVCPDCGERDGKIWMIDGEPVGDAPEWIPAPLHPRCRCIAIPMDIPADQIDSVAADSADNFGDFLDTMSTDQQDGILGVGRAELWRNGDISLSDLVGQDGLMMTLSEIQAELADG